MDQEMGACCVRSRAGVSPDSTIVNQIMLRFRPIAPKPATGSDGFPAKEEPREGITGSKRRKRRYVRVCGTRKGSGRREKRSSSGGSKEESNNKGCRSDKDKVKTLRSMPGERASEERDLGPLDLNMAPRVEAESWVTVLSVTDACMDGGGFGCTGEDRWRDLDGDTCPGFISDANTHVLWSNAAFRRMVAGRLGEEAVGPVTVKLWASESVLLPVLPPAFACMVRVQYTWRQERGPEESERLVRVGKATVVPCDVWRMNGGGYAWRLDVKAGLSLGWNCIH